MSIEHGGALDRAIAVHGGKRSEWLDLSTGINPVPLPLPDLSPEVWARLPDEALHGAAIDGAREFYRIPETAGVVAAPGTQALIQILPGLRTPGEVAVVGPTYAEHAASFARCGWRVRQIADLADLPENATAALLVNPNNPDGRIAEPAAILRAHDLLAARSGMLIVDEAFADMAPEGSVGEYAARPGLIVLKSFGKFFGLAGLRLGFAVTHRDDAAWLEERLGPWAVSGPALAVAAQAFTDRDGIRRMRERLRHQRALLSRALRAADLREIGGTALFALAEHPGAELVHDALCRHAVLVRRFDYAPTWLRFGLPGGEAEAIRLEEALLSALDEILKSRT